MERVDRARRYSEALMHLLLRLYEDVLQGGSAEIGLSPAPRMIFVVHGAMMVEGKAISDGETWNGEDGASVEPGANGVTCWRFELAPAGSGSAELAGGHIRSHLKLSAALETVPKGELLMRGDSVAFSSRWLRVPSPPSGAGHPLPDRGRHSHRHQGPFDKLWTRRRLVRERTRPRLRPGRGRSSKPFHPGHDPAARIAGQEFVAIGQRRR